MIAVEVGTRIPFPAWLAAMVGSLGTEAKLLHHDLMAFSTLELWQLRLQLLADRFNLLDATRSTNVNQLAYLDGDLLSC